MKRASFIGSFFLLLMVGERLAAENGRHANLSPEGEEALRAVEPGMSAFIKKHLRLEASEIKALPQALESVKNVDEAPIAELLAKALYPLTKPEVEETLRDAAAQIRSSSGKTEEFMKRVAWGLKVRQKERGKLEASEPASKRFNEEFAANLEKEANRFEEVVAAAKRYNSKTTKVKSDPDRLKVVNEMGGSFALRELENLMKTGSRDEQDKAKEIFKALSAPIDATDPAKGSGIELVRKENGKSVNYLFSLPTSSDEAAKRLSDFNATEGLKGIHLANKPFAPGVAYNMLEYGPDGQGTKIGSFLVTPGRAGGEYVAINAQNNAPPPPGGDRKPTPPAGGKAGQNDGAALAAAQAVVSAKCIGCHNDRKKNGNTNLTGSIAGKQALIRRGLDADMDKEAKLTPAEKKALEDFAK